MVHPLRKPSCLIKSILRGDVSKKRMNDQGKLIFLFLLIPGNRETTVRKCDLRFLEVAEDSDMQQELFSLGVEKALSGR
jgi:hypothetical protein